MLSFLAALVDHAAARIVLGLAGVAVTASFGTLSAILLIANAPPGESPVAFLIGLGGCLGVVGWWSRVFIGSRVLAHRPAVRLCVVSCLAAGVMATFAGMPLFPRNSPGHAQLWAMAGVGILLLLGSLGSAGAGPDDPFKPRPLRGSA